MKRVLSFILAVALIATLLPALPAQAATSGTTGSCTWTLNGTELTISGSGAMGNYTSVGPWGSSITKVTIQSGVTSIGSYAFYNCTKLSSVSIASTVKEIGSYAFRYCTSLKSVSIPNNVTYMGSETFYGCSALTSVSIGTGLTDSLVASAFLRCSSLTSISVSSGNSYLMSKGNCIISKRSKTLIVGCKSSVIPTDGSVTYIGNSAFRYVTGLSSITIPASVTGIGNYAFSNASVSSVTLNSGLTSIGDYAFNGSNIRSVVIPDSVTSLGTAAFSDCSYLSSITIGSGVTKIEPTMFSRCARNTLIVSANNPKYHSVRDKSIIETATNTLVVGDRYGYIPEGVVIIGRLAFNDCVSISTVTIPEGVTTISYSAFNGCTSLKTAVIPDSVTTIETYAFTNCSALTSLTIGSGVTVIDDIAFSGCSKLTSLNIPGSVKTIGGFAFSGCYALETLVLNEGIERIEESAFRSCTSLADISLPDSVTSIHHSAFYDTAYSNDTANYDGSVLYIGKHLMGSVETTCSGVYQVRPGTTVIADYAFYNNTGLTQVVMPDGVTHIGGYAFYNNTGLTQVVMPDSVTYIGDYAFYKCTALTEFPLSASLTVIGPYAFYGVKKPTSLVIPDGVTTIGKYAFYSCTGIVTARLSKSLESIGTYELAGTSKLERLDISPENLRYYSKDGILYYRSSNSMALKPYAHKLYLNIRYLDSKGNPIAEPQFMKYTSNATYSVVPPEIPGYYTETTLISGKMTSDLDVDILYYEKTIVASGTFGNDIRWTLYDDGMLVLRGKGVMPEGDAPWSGYADQILSLYIDSRITSVSGSAFRNCAALTYIDFGYGVTTIGANAFAGCTGLTALYLPDTVTAIGDGAFSGCAGLKAVVLPDSVTTIGANAFAGCTGLEKVTLGAAVDTIADNAFGGCTGLTQVYFRGRPAVLGTEALGSTAGKYVYYYAGVNGWEEEIHEGLWNGYMAVPYQAISREDFTGTNVYILKIVDRHNTPLVGAVVQLGDQVQSTNADGMAYFVRPQSPVVLTVSCSNHITFEDDSYTPQQGRVLDYVELSDRPSTVQGVSCNGRSIATSVYTLNCNSQDTVKLTVKGYSKYDIVRYELLQGTRVITAEQTSAQRVVFQVPADSFEEGQTVIVKMYTADGAVVASALNVQPLWIADVSGDQILKELSQLELHLELGSLGNFDLPLTFKSANGQEVYTSVDGNTIRVGLNVDVNKLFEQEKDEVTAKTRIQKEIQEKTKTFAKGNAGFQYDLAGYIEIEYLGQGEYYVKTSYVKIAVSAGLEFSAQASYFGVVGVYFKASLTGQGSLDLTVSRYSPEQGFVLNDANLGIENTLRLEGGAYLLWGAGSASMYGQLSMGFQLGIVPDVEFESVYVTGELGVKWSVLWGLFAGSKTIVGGDIYRWPEVQAYTLMALRSAASETLAFNDRSYLEHRSPWQSGDGLQNGLGFDGAPQVVTCGDTTVMVWLDDNPDRDSSNYQTLYYSVYDPAADSWSAPAQVDNNETFDCEFCLYTDGQGIYVLYTEQKAVLAGLESLDPTDPQAVTRLIGGVEVSFTQFVDGAFADPVRLTDNDICETLPVLTGAGENLRAFWTATDAMNSAAQAQTSQIYAAHRTGDGWSEGTVCAGEQNGISDMSGLSFDGATCFAFLLDGDNDPQTEEDMLLILSDGSAARQVAQGRVTDVSVGQIDGKDYLLWNQDGGIYALNRFDGQAIPLLPEDVQANGAYRLLDISPDDTLLTYTAGSQIWGILVSDTGWLGSPVLLMEREGTVGRYDAAMVEDRLLLTFTQTTATIDGETVQTETLLDYAIYSFHTDLKLDAADFDISVNPLEVTVTLRNEGLTDVHGATVNLYDPEGTLIATGDYAVSVRQGQSATLTATLTLEQILQGQYTLEVIPAGTTDSQPENNQIPIVPGYSDLAVSARQTVIGGRNYLAIQIDNSGNLPSAGQLLVYGKDGNLIGTLEVPTLAAGGQDHYLMDVDAFTDEEQNMVKCQVTAQGYDPFVLNDTCSVTLFYTNNEDFQTDPEDIISNPTLSTYSAVYDRRIGGDISFTITAGIESFTGVTGLPTFVRSGNNVILRNVELRNLAVGRYALQICFGSIVRSFTLEVIDSTPTALSGSVAILGQAQVGNTVYADLSALRPEGSDVSCTWTVDGATVSNDSYYQLRPEDAQKTLTLTITGNEGYTGTFSTKVTVTLNQPAPPLKPVVIQVTHTSVTLAAADGVEYSLNKMNWQTSPVFTGLTVNRSYTFYARYGATADSAASQPSAGVTVTTPKYTADAPAAPVAEQITDVSVTLVAQAGVLYSMDGESWQTSPAFAGLDANTTYTFYQKLAETDTTLESPVSNGLSVTTRKHTAPKPPMPTAVQRSATTLSLEYVAGYEYSMDGVNWQNLDSGLWHAPSAFTGLSPNTTYTFYQRVAETDDTYASEPSEPLLARTWKHTAGAPSAPAVAEVTANSITLTAEPGYEYKILTVYDELTHKIPISPGIWGTEQEPVPDNTGWQTSPVFEGLEPNRRYYLFRRTAETDTAYASWESDFLKVWTLKAPAPAPTAPAVQEVFWDSVELVHEEGYQYRMDDGDWQDSPLFTGLLPNRSYTFYRKRLETDAALESESSTGTTVTTLKKTQSQPTPPEVAEVTHDSITLEYNDLYAYRIWGGEWQTSPTFTGLAPYSDYAVYRKLLETDEAYESVESEPLWVTTPKAPTPAPAAPVVEYVDSSIIILVEQPGCQFRIDDGPWRTACVFLGLQPNQSYTIYCRVAETSTTLASEPSVGTIVTTLKKQSPTPSSPVVCSISWNEVVLEEQAGYQYRIEGGQWQDSPVFSGLLPNRSYTFYRKQLGTDTTYESVSSSGTTVTTLKQTVNPPEAPVMLENTLTSITLRPTEGYEYSMGGELWYSSNVFENLEPGKSYVFYQRAKETDTTYESPISSGATLSTQDRYWLDGVLTVEGAPCYGGTLRAVYSDSEATMTYQWYADGVAIEGATGDSYTVRLEDVGKTIMVAITGTGSYVGFVEMAAERDAYLSGDVTGDGKVNMKDWNRLYEHINEINPLFEEAQQRADVTGDGKVNMKDWNRLYEHINEIDPLW